MQENPRTGEHIARELSPSQQVIEALGGAISEPVTTISQKPGFEGQVVKVRLVEDGAGLLGLSDLRDNKEWSGIFNHVLLSTRYATHFATQLKDNGYFINPQRVLDGMLSSHNGRRQWDEARWYPEAVPDAAIKHVVSNETLGAHINHGKIPNNAFELVVSLGHNIEGYQIDPHIYNTLDYKVAIYADHRTSQAYEPLYVRMGDFLLRNFFNRSSVTESLKTNVYEGMQAIVELRRAQSLGRYAGEMTLDAADAIAKAMGASTNSSRILRKDLMQLVLQDADTEARLLGSGVDVDLNDATTPMPAWEHDLRRQYVQSAESEIITKFDDLQLTQPKTWWEQYALDLYADWSDPFMFE